jgi:hypothetical protein
MRENDFVANEENDGFSYSAKRTSSRLEVFTQTKKVRTTKEIRAGLGENSVVEFNGLPVAVVHDRSRDFSYPHVVVLDHADPDFQRPLYAMTAKAGRFLQYYQMRKPGDAQVFTVTHGFEVPKLDVYRASVLEDEITPESHRGEHL